MNNLSVELHLLHRIMMFRGFANLTFYMDNNFLAIYTLDTLKLVYNNHHFFKAYTKKEGHFIKLL